MFAIILGVSSPEAPSFNIPFISPAVVFPEITLASAALLSSATFFSKLLLSAGSFCDVALSPGCAGSGITPAAVEVEEELGIGNAEDDLLTSIPGEEDVLEDEFIAEAVAEVGKVMAEVREETDVVVAVDEVECDENLRDLTPSCIVGSFTL